MGTGTAFGYHTIDVGFNDAAEAAKFYNGMHWTRAPGNLYSTAERIEIGSGLGNNFELEMSNVMPPIPNQGIVIRTNTSRVGVCPDDLRNLRADRARIRST